MDDKTKKKISSLLNEIMKLSLPYCQDEDDKLSRSASRINNDAHELLLLLEKKLMD